MLTNVRALGGGFSNEAAAITAFALLSLTILTPIEIGIAIVGTGVLLASRAFGEWQSNIPERIRNTALVASIVVLSAGLAVWFLGERVVAVTSGFLMVLALAVGYLALRAPVEEKKLRVVAAGLLVMVVIALGVIQIVSQPDPSIDVFDLHVSAADALVGGKNPYVAATAVNTAPTAAEGEMVVGYPYPPLTLMAYAGGEILFGEPRWISVIAIAITVLLLVRPWALMTRGQAGAAVALAVAIVTQPVLSHIIRMGWTEPIAVPLLLGVGLLWRRHPLGSAVLLGLTLGLKQYWIVALPLLLVWNDDYRWKRLLIAGGVAVLSLVPAFVVDPGAAWDSMVVSLLEVPSRLDSVGVAGFGWELPMWLILVASIGAALWMSRSAGPAPRFLLGLLATLATAFVLGSQVFVNYWFLIASGAIVAIATCAALADRVPLVLDGAEPIAPDGAG